MAHRSFVIVTLVLASVACAHPSVPVPRVPGTFRRACGTVGQFYGQTPADWVQYKTDEWLNTWWTENSTLITNNQNGFAGAFGQWALGNPDWSCKDSGSPSNCDLNICDNPVLNGLGDAETIRQAYYILEAVNRFHGFLSGLNEAWGITAVAASLDKDIWVNYFWRYPDVSDQNLLNLLLGIITTIFGLGAAFAGLAGSTAVSVAAGVMNNVASGVINAGKTAASGGSPTEFGFNTAAGLGHALSAAVLSTSNGLSALNDQLMYGSNFDNTGDIRTYLKDGYWVNFPGLNKVDATSAMQTMLQSIAINWVYRQQPVFILGGGPCIGDMNAQPGVGDDLPFVWCDADNKAWFLYAWQPNQNQWDPHGPEQFGTATRPWGSDRLGAPSLMKQKDQSATDEFPTIYPRDIIKSSVASYRAAGNTNNYDSSKFQSRMLSLLANGNNPANDGAAMEGLWTIPVCDLSGNSEVVVPRRILKTLDFLDLEEIYATPTTESVEEMSVQYGHWKSLQQGIGA